MQAPTTSVRLTKRDHAILRLIQDHDVLDRRQIQTTIFKDTPSQLIRCNRRLRQLRLAGLIAEVPQFLPGHTDRPSVYTTTIEGAHLLGAKKRTRELRVSPYSLEHRRTTNSKLLKLRESAQAMGWEIATEASQATSEINKPIHDWTSQLRTSMEYMAVNRPANEAPRPFKKPTRFASSKTGY